MATKAWNYVCRRKLRITLLVWVTIYVPLVQANMDPHDMSLCLTPGKVWDSLVDPAEIKLHLHTWWFMSVILINSHNELTRD